MDGRVKRPDLCNREIAENWLGGMSQFDLSIKYSCSPNTISTRLRAARREFPDLPWGSPRTVIGTSGESPKNYIRMNDGRPGKSTIREGSIVNSRTMRRRP